MSDSQVQLSYAFMISDELNTGTVHLDVPVEGDLDTEAEIYAVIDKIHRLSAAPEQASLVVSVNEQFYSYGELMAFLQLNQRLSKGIPSFQELVCSPDLPPVIEWMQALPPQHSNYYQYDPIRVALRLDRDSTLYIRLGDPTITRRFECQAGANLLTLANRGRDIPTPDGRSTRHMLEISFDGKSFSSTEQTVLVMGRGEGEPHLARNSASFRR